MIKTLTRYVLREYCVPLAYCLGGFVSIYVLFELFGSFSRLAEAKLPFWTTVQYFCGYLAPHFEWLAPAALMLAALYTMWGFCRHSELVAMRASGIGFVTIVKPILLVAALMAAFVYWINESYVPARAQWAKQLRSAHFDRSKIALGEDLIFRIREVGRTWNIGRVEDADGYRLGDVKVVVDRPGHATRLYCINAERAECLDGEWWFSGVRVQHYDERGSEIASPVPELDALSFRPFPQFTEHPRDILSQNRDWRYNSVRDKFRFLRKHTNLTDSMRREYAYDAWAGLFAPLACIIITLFAIPAGVASGRQSVFRGILGALGMFFAFYALTIGCMVVAQLGYLPPFVAAALPDVVFLGLGLWMFRRQR